MVSTQRNYQLSEHGDPDREPDDGDRQPAAARMSLPATTAPPACRVVNQALEPAWVRHGSPATQKDYATRLGFEQMLVEQLTQSLTRDQRARRRRLRKANRAPKAAPRSGGGDSQISSMLPQALTASVMHGGGLGLAAQLTHQLHRRRRLAAQAQATARPAASGPGNAPAGPITGSGGGNAPASPIAGSGGGTAA